MTQLNSNTKESKFITLKYILGVLLILASIGAIAQSKILSAIFYLILGLLFLPPVSNQIRAKLKYWQNKNIRYFTYVTLFILASAFVGKNNFKSINKTSTATTDSGIIQIDNLIYQDYSSKVEKNISQLSTDRLQLREKWIKELSQNSIYIQLVTQKIVSVDYLLTLTAISDAIKNSTTKDDKSQFQIDDKIASNIESSKDGKSKMQFVVDVASLSLKINGGLPKEIISVFERYRTKYSLFSNEPKTFYNATGKTENLQETFNIIYTFALLDPKNEKVLDAIYETNFSDTGSWNEDDANLDYPYMSNKTAYLDHLKNVFQDSKYLPKMNDIDVWDEFGADVKTRIELLIFNKDCEGLQKEFNNADENIKRFHNAGSNSVKHTKLMDFVDEQMKEIGCYN